MLEIFILDFEYLFGMKKKIFLNLKKLLKLIEKIKIPLFMI
jgi:hypothetical protein